MNQNNGFVLLFAVMLSSIILAIALGVASVALKEINFSTSAKDANNAFYSADTGIECALFNDKPPLAIFPNNASQQVTCLGGFININSTDWTNGPWNFVLPGLGSSNDSCAIIDVTKVTVNGSLSTTIISKGYNNGGGFGGCTPNSSSVERELQVTY